MQLRQKYSDHGLEALTLSLDGEDDFAAANTILGKLDLPLDHFCLKEGMSDEGMAISQLGDGGFPLLHFYDRKGRLRQKLEGLVDDEQIESIVEELIAESEGEGEG